ncbi:MAG: hypothetical protein JSW53_00740 [Candidatus Bathyarchaeota archaeon]|nr:MAG: hypothetical protein JSW53_00740 [Candidatus Bathyarchaeota archaeon]
MKERLAGLLLVCLVALSIVYVCSSTILYCNVPPSLDGVTSWPALVLEEARHKGKPTDRGPPMDIMGDPVEDVKPH